MTVCGWAALKEMDRNDDRDWRKDKVVTLSGLYLGLSQMVRTRKGSVKRYTLER